MEKVSLTEQEKNKKSFSVNQVTKIVRKEVDDATLALSRLYDQEIDAKVDSKLKSREEHILKFLSTFSEKSNKFLEESQRRIDCITATHHKN